MFEPKRPPHRTESFGAARRAHLSPSASSMPGRPSGGSLIRGIAFHPLKSRRSRNQREEAPMMDFQQAALTICGATVVFVLYKRYRALSISDIPGPANPSWIYGISLCPLCVFDETISHVLEQGTAGGGNAENWVYLKRVSWKNTEP